MVFKKLVVLTAAMVLCAAVPALGKGGGRSAGAGSSASSGTGTTTTPGASVPVNTKQNGAFSNSGTFANPVGIGQAVPPATSTTSTTGNQVGATPGAPTVSNSGTVGTGLGARLPATTTSGVAGAGTAPNGLPIGSPGSGKGSPENPY